MRSSPHISYTNNYDLGILALVEVYAAFLRMCIMQILPEDDYVRIYEMPDPESHPGDKPILQHLAD